MSKSLEELKDLFSNFDGNLQAEFIDQFPEIWDDCYDIEMGSRYHRLMTSCMLAGWFAAIKAVSERENDALKFIKDKIEYHKQAYSLDLFPNSEKLDDNSTRESISAKMGRHMCDVFLCYLNEALKDYRGMK